MLSIYWTYFSQLSVDKVLILYGYYHISINVEDSLIVVLTDNHGNPIENQTINIKLKDKDGIGIDKNTTTNPKGKAKFKMEEKGNNSIECKFDGNNKICINFNH